MLPAEGARKEEPYRPPALLPPVRTPSCRPRAYKRPAARATRGADMSGSGGERDASRFGGAAADFITSLGRKSSELRPLLAALAEDPASRMREDLRRKLHALGV